MIDPFTHAQPSELQAALEQEDDLERRIRACCAIGDQLRFAELKALTPGLREALVACTKREEFDDLAYEASIALCEARDEAGSVLLRLLNDKSRRFDATKALSRLRGDDVRSVLGKQARRMLLPWPDQLVASAACAVFGDKEGAAYFEKTLTARFFTSRRAMALHLFGELRHPEAFVVLMSIAEREGDPYRPVAIRALGHLGDQRAVEKLRLFSKSEVEEDVRYALDLL